MESIASFAPPSLSRGLFGKLNNSCNGGGGGCFTANPRNCCFLLANSYSSSFLPLSYSSQNLTSTTTSLSLKRRSTSVIVAGKKNKNFQKKADNHSFVSKPDESTGPFPEAVLLKQVHYFCYYFSLSLSSTPCPHSSVFSYFISLQFYMLVYLSIC